MRPRRLIFHHLSGSRRGLADDVRLPARIGSADDAEVRVPEAAPSQVLLFERGGEVVAQDAGAGTGFQLGGESVQEAVLRDGDVLDLGPGGTKLRFRDLGRSHASLRMALGWARPEGPGRPLPDAAHFLRTLLREAHARTSGLFRASVVLLLLGLAAALGWSAVQARKMRIELDRLRASIQATRDEQSAFREKVEAERRRFDEERQRLRADAEEHKARERDLNRRLADAQAGEVQAVRSDLQATRERILNLESERAAAERIIRDYGPGVCLIQGTMVFADESGRLYRYVLDEAGRPRRGEDGEPRLDPMGRGEIHKVEYVGTGFLVEAKGLVLTNRHVAEPWWKDSAAEALTKAGATPRLLTFRAFFPREAEPFALAVERVSPSVDLALVRVQLRGRRIPAPALPLDRSGEGGAVAGYPVVVLGYPAGLEALVAKAEADTVNEIVNATGLSPARIAEGLAAKGLIRPSATQGHIGDVTGSDIVFDAQTTHGGSGGPVLNRTGQVVAVEYAVLAGFGGNSFGVPVRYALDLLRPPPKVKAGG
jgi:S1-C subfamily serine protease